MRESLKNRCDFCSNGIDRTQSDTWGNPGYLVPYLLLSCLLWAGWHALAAYVSQCGGRGLRRTDPR